MKGKYDLKPHQPGKMTKIGQAAWLCGSFPLGCIITDLEKVLLLSTASIYFRKRLPITTVGDNTFGTLKLNEWPVMCGRVARCSC